MKDAEAHSGLNLAVDAPELLPLNVGSVLEPASSNDSALGHKQPRDPLSPLENVAGLCVVKLEDTDEDCPQLSSENQRLSAEVDKLKKERNNLHTQVIKLEAKTACDISRVSFHIFQFL